MDRTLGVEGGGTKTEWIYVSDEEGRKSGVLPGSNLRLVTDEALERMFRVLPKEPTKVGVFLAGCVNDADRARLAACVRRVWPDAEIRVGSDRESGFATAFRDGDGVAVIAGTGSAITGRRDGHYEKAGGWGHLLGDKGSGFDLSMQALRNVLWTYDLTRRITAPAEEFLSRLGLSRLEDLVAWAKEADKMSVAQLSPVVFEAAEEGDEAMLAIIDAGASALADGAHVVADRLGLVGPLVRLQGGLFARQPLYLESFGRRMAELDPLARVEVCSASGAEGALYLAGHQAPEKVLPKVEVDLAELASALTEQRNPRSERLGEMPTADMVDLFISEEARVGEALENAREALVTAIDLTSELLRNGGRLFYVGAGTSGRLGVLDASEIPPTFGEPPDRVQAIMAGGVTALYRAVEGAEDQAEGGALAVLQRGVRAGDVVCGITASGRTPFVLGALQEARALGAKCILLSCNPKRRRHGAPWDVEIDLAAGPELLTGSTRLKAGTATKCALNILSTGTMVRLGKVRGNLMAGVVVSNAKLRDRAIRLVSTMRGVDSAQAEGLLEQNGWDVRRCIH